MRMIGGGRQVRVAWRQSLELLLEVGNPLLELGDQRLDERAGRLRFGRKFESVVGSWFGHGRIEAEKPVPSQGQFQAKLAPTRERLRKAATQRAETHSPSRRPPPQVESTPPAWFAESFPGAEGTFLGTNAVEPRWRGLLALLSLQLARGRFRFSDPRPSGEWIFVVATYVRQSLSLKS